MAFATPEKRWFRDVSKGLFHISVAIAIATPVLKWLTTWAIQCCIKQMAQRRRPIIYRGCNSSVGAWLIAFGQTLNKTSLHIERLLLSQNVITCPRQFVRNGLERHDAIGTILLALIKSFRFRAKP